MNRQTNLLLAVVAALSLSGCVVVNGEHTWSDKDWQKQQRENRQIISELSIGMERSEVVSRLGTPNYSEAYTRDGDDFRVLYFRTQHRHSDGDTSRDETTPLVFKNDTLVGWGEEVLASVGGVSP